MWPEAIEHANKSLIIAREKGLIEQELESLKHLSTAYRKTGDLNSALDVIDNIIALTQAQQKQDNDESSGNTTELTEQKLKFELGLQQAKLSQHINDNQHKQFIIILLFCLCIMIAVVLLFALNRSQKIIKSQRRYKKLHWLDPLTELNGLRACIKRLKDSPDSEIRSFALIKIDALTHIDVNLGMSESMKILHAKIAELSQILAADIYLIKPGQIACCFNHPVEAKAIYQKLTDYLHQATFSNPIIPCFNSHHHANNIYIGHINLPLLDNHDVFISPELHFETAQFALGSAMTQQQSTYVSLKTLNFAPAAIFSAPLYLNLTQAMKRGIVKAESNQLITENYWPK
jgi:tetratricopeptide (TPR) repeat protein